MNLIDTADAYAFDGDDIGHGERLVAKALQGAATACSSRRRAATPARARPGTLDGRPEHIRAACEASLRALETDVIDLYQFHRPDPDVPYAESIGAFRELQAEGKVRWVGISNANVEQLEEARSIVEIVARAEPARARTSRRRSPRARSRPRPSAGIAFLPWSPLGGIGRADGTGTVEPVAAAAEAHGVSPQQVALAWLLALSPTMIPIPGSSRPETIADSARAVELELSDDERGAISARGGRLSGYAVRFPPQADGDAAGERIEVAWDDGRTETLRIQDYARVFAIPGLYEEVVQRRLGCRTPERVAALLGRRGRRRRAARARRRRRERRLGRRAAAAAGLDPVVGLDLEPAARDAALRDRPGRYGAYLVADLAALAPAEEATIRAARPQALACVGSVGGGHLPPSAVLAGLQLLEPPALLAYAFDVGRGRRPAAGGPRRRARSSRASATCTAGRSPAASGCGKP